MSKTETMDEYLARGGKITVAKKAPEKFDHSAIYRKDKKLQALKALKKQPGLSEQDIEYVERAIFTRIEILKVTF